MKKRKLISILFSLFLLCSIMLIGCTKIILGDDVVYSNQCTSCYEALFQQAVFLDSKGFKIQNPCSIDTEVTWNLVKVEACHIDNLCAQSCKDFCDSTNMSHDCLGCLLIEDQDNNSLSECIDDNE